jgi:hypothetical protein
MERFARWLGLTLGLVTALLLALFAHAIAATLQAWGVPPILLEGMVQDGFLLCALSLSLGFILFFGIGFGLPCLLLSLDLSRLQASLQALVRGGGRLVLLEQLPVHTASLRAGLQAYLSALAPTAAGNHGDSVLFAPPATSILSVERMIMQPLHARLFQTFGLALGLLGVLLGLAALVEGLQMPSAPLVGLFSGLRALAVCLSTALLLWLFLVVMLEARRWQLARLCQLLDQQSQLLDARFLAAHFASFTAVLEQSVQAQSASLEAMIAAGVKSFQAQLAQSYGDQLKAMGTAAERLRRTVDLAATHLKNADTAINKQFSSSLEAIHSTAATQTQEGIASFNMAAEQTLAHLQQAAQMSIALSRTLVEALTREGGEPARPAAQQIAEISAAAQLNRETLERLLVLHEQLQALSKEVPLKLPARAIEPPLANPETTRRLSTAIRNLRQVASETLPEL